MREDLMLALRRGGIHPERLSAMQRILLTTDGTVTDMLETYREIIRCERRAAADLATHFGCYDSAPLLTRTYVVTLGGKGIMRITERFPEYGM